MHIARAQGAAIKIGFPVPLTGAFSAEAQDQVRAAELAIKEFNAAGGYKGRKAELLVRDGSRGTTLRPVDRVLVCPVLPAVLLDEARGRRLVALEEAGHLGEGLGLFALGEALGEALVDPARLVWGLADAVRRAGVTIWEETSLVDLERSGAGMAVRTSGGTIRAGAVLLATNAFRSPVAAVNRRIEIGRAHV